MAEPPTPAPARHEESDAPAGRIAAGLLLMLPVLLGIGFLPLWLFPGSTRDEAPRGALPLYPEPRLQSAPQAAMQRFAREEQQALDTIRWSDRAAGLVHIPPEQAMRRLLDRGIPDWPAK